MVGVAVEVVVGVTVVVIIGGGRSGRSGSIVIGRPQTSISSIIRNLCWFY